MSARWFLVLPALVVVLVGTLLGLRSYEAYQSARRRADEEREIVLLLAQAEEMASAERYETALRLFREAGLKAQAADRSDLAQKAETRLLDCALSEHIDQLVRQAADEETSGRRDLAADSLRQALKLKEDPALEKRLTDLEFSRSRDEARAFAQARQWEPAIQAFRKALGLRLDAGLDKELTQAKEALEAERDAAYRQLSDEAQKLAQADQYDEAVRKLEKALPLAREPDRVQKRLEEYRAHATAIDKAVTNLLSSAGRQLEKKRFRKARDEAQQILRWKPDQREAKELLVRANEALALENMVLVPVGTLIVPAAERAFYIDRTEVTNRQYEEFLRATGRRPPPFWEFGINEASWPDLPVTGVTLEEAIAYAAWAGKRLPSPFEWVRAARGAEDWAYPWGAAAESTAANSRDSGRRKPAAVGSFPRDRSPFGSMDLAGNVSEWTVQGAGDAREGILMGGSFLYWLQDFPIDRHVPEDPFVQLADVGFRCVKDAPEEERHR